MTFSSIAFFFIAFFGAIAFAVTRQSKPRSIDRAFDCDPHILLPEWKSLVQLYVPVVAKMPKARRADLYRLTMRFMREKTFEGRDGLVVDEAMAVIIASQACLLLLGRPTTFYPTLDKVLIFPSVFAVQHSGLDGLYVGVSYRKGPIALAWDHAHHGAIHPHDGHNVVIHEFAHQLDQETGLYDGVPVIEDPAQYDEWKRVMTEGREALTAQVEAGESTVLNPYGTSSSEEFFAVATESFFETPGPLKLVFPEVYKELTLYYRLDPAEWERVV